MPRVDGGAVDINEDGTPVVTHQTEQQHLAEMRTSVPGGEEFTGDNSRYRPPSPHNPESNVFTGRHSELLTDKKQRLEKEAIDKLKKQEAAKYIRAREEETSKALQLAKQRTIADEGSYAIIFNLPSTTFGDYVVPKRGWFGEPDRPEYCGRCRVLPAVPERNFGPFKEKQLQLLDDRAKDVIDFYSDRDGYTATYQSPDSIPTIMTKTPVQILVKIMQGLSGREISTRIIEQLQGAYSISMEPEQNTCMNVIVNREPNNSGGGYDVNTFSLYYPEKKTGNIDASDLLKLFSFRTGVFDANLLGARRVLKELETDSKENGLESLGMTIVWREDCVYVKEAPLDDPKKRFHRIEKIVNMMDELYGLQQQHGEDNARVEMPEDHPSDQPPAQPTTPIVDQRQGGRGGTRGSLNDPAVQTQGGGWWGGKNADEVSISLAEAFNSKDRSRGMTALRSQWELLKDYLALPDTPDTPDEENMHLYLMIPIKYHEDIQNFQAALAELLTGDDKDPLALIKYLIDMFGFLDKIYQDIIYYFRDYFRNVDVNIDMVKYLMKLILGDNDTSVMKLMSSLGQQLMDGLELKPISDEEKGELMDEVVSAISSTGGEEIKDIIDNVVDKSIARAKKFPLSLMDIMDIISILNSLAVLDELKKVQGFPHVQAGEDVAKPLEVYTLHEYLISIVESSKNIPPLGVFIILLVLLGQTFKGGHTMSRIIGGMEGSFQDLFNEMIEDYVDLKSRVTEIIEKDTMLVELGKKFICTHQGRMQYLMGRELIDGSLNLVIDADLKLEIIGIEADVADGKGWMKSVPPRLRIGNKQSAPFQVQLLRTNADQTKSIDDHFSKLIGDLPEGLKNRKQGDRLYDYLMCASYIKFKNCAILHLKFEPTPLNGKMVTKLTIELVHGGSLEEDEKIVTREKDDTYYWTTEETDKGKKEYAFPKIKLLCKDSSDDRDYQLSGDIYVMRHGYGEHNRAKMDGSKSYFSKDLTDAALTPGGVKQCVKAAEEFEEPLEGFAFFCSDLRRTWQSLSAFNKRKKNTSEITMLPYMHEFEYKSIEPYTTDDVFLTKGIGGYLAKVTGRFGVPAAAIAAGTAVALGAGPAALVPLAGKALAATGVTAVKASTAASVGTGIATGITGHVTDTALTTYDANGPDIGKLTPRRRYSPRAAADRFKSLFRQEGGSAGSALGGRAGYYQMKRKYSYENRSKFREEGSFVGTEFTAEIPKLETVTVKTDFYGSIKKNDPVLEEYRYTFFSLLIEHDNYLLGKRLQGVLTKKDLSPGENPSWYNLPGQVMQSGRKMKRSFKSRGSQQQLKRGKLDPRIQFVQGDITKFGINAFRGKGLTGVVADYAIVNAANVLGLGGAGLDEAINEAGGRKLIADRKIMMGKGYMKPGEARATSNGPYNKLKVKHIIHAVGADFRCVPGLRRPGDNPIYIKYGGCENSDTKEKAVERLRYAYLNSIDLAKRLGVKYLAFPVLSGKIFTGSVRTDELIDIAIDAINSADKTGIELIFFYILDEENYDRTVSRYLRSGVKASQGGGYRKTHKRKNVKKTRKNKTRNKTRKKTNKKTSKKTRKKISKKNGGTKMRKKKTHNRTKKNKKNKRNP